MHLKPLNKQGFNFFGKFIPFYLEIKSFVVSLTYQNDKDMKSILFKTAWKIFKTGKTFSESLKMAWAYVKYLSASQKQEATMDTYFSYNEREQKEMILYACKSIKAKTVETYNEVVSILMPKTNSNGVTMVSNGGAASYYGNGTKHYNGD